MNIIEFNLNFYFIIESNSIECAMNNDILIYTNLPFCMESDIYNYSITFDTLSIDYTTNKMYVGKDIITIN